MFHHHGHGVPDHPIGADRDQRGAHDPVDVNVAGLHILCNDFTVDILLRDDPDRQAVLQYDTTADLVAAHGLCRTGDRLPNIDGRWMAPHDLPDWYPCLKVDDVAIVHYGILLIWSR